MAQSYTRQSTFSDGDTITAALFNDEYNQLLNAFAYSNTSAASTGHRHDGTAGEGGNIHTIGDLDFNNKIVVDDTNNRWGFYVEVSSAAVEQIRIQDGAMIPVTDSDVDLGTSSLYWKDAYIDSVTTTGNISIGGNLTVTGNATISGNLTFGDADTDSITLTADVASHITPDTDDTYDLGSSTKEWRDIYIDGTAYLDAINFNGTAITATAAELNIMDGVTSTTAELNILDGVTATATELNIMDGDTAATSTTLADADRVVVNDAGTMKQVALTDFETYFESAIDTISGDLTITGDLTISGDDLVMGTNTAGHLLIADGTNFNPTAVGDLAEITSVASDDVLLAVDTSGGGLKKIQRSTLVSGLASSNAISNVVEDTTPQLGGDLDVNGQDIVSVSNGNITITPNGTGLVRLDGNVDIQSGEIVLKNSGSVSNIKFYCEVTNAHYTQLQSSPHSAYSGNVTLTLPATTDTLVGKTTTDTLTNKTLTAPTMTGIVTINSTDALTLPVGTTAQRPTAVQGMLRYNTTDSQFEGYNGSAWDTIGGGAEFAYTRTSATATASQTTFSATYTAGYVDVYLNGVKLVSGTDFTATNGTSVVLTTGATVGDNVEILAYETFAVANALLAANNLSDLSSAATAITNLGITSTAAELNILDGVTSTTAELNILDGVTATTTELNYLDITTLGTTEASKAVTADANGVVTFDNGISEEYTAVTSSSNATTVNLRDGTNFSHTLTENTTFTFSNPASSGKVSSFTLKLVQDASASGYTVTWPASVDWPSATAPTLTATASAVDYFVFITHDGGTTYYGFTAGQALG